MILKGDNIYIRELEVEDVSKVYLNWLNDKEVTKFLECRFKTYYLDDLKDFVTDMKKSSNNILFGIFLNKKVGEKIDQFESGFSNLDFRHRTYETDEHIGNIKIGSINHIHKFADVGIMIGVKEYWGKGYGTEAIKLVTEYSFEILKLRKLIAGMYADNVGSYRAFIRSGYKEIGAMKNHWKFEDGFMDGILLEKINPEFNIEKNRKEWNELS